MGHQILVPFIATIASDLSSSVYCHAVTRMQAVNPRVSIFSL